MYIQFMSKSVKEYAGIIKNRKVGVTTTSLTKQIKPGTAE